MPENTTSPQREIIEFYKEEFLKHKTRIQIQKEFHSDRALSDIEVALDKIIDEIETICRMDRFSELASQLLERIDIVTNLSGSPSNQSQRIH
jgi:hypothetical protein